MGRDQLLRIQPTLSKNRNRLIHGEGGEQRAGAHLRQARRRGPGLERHASTLYCTFYTRSRHVATDAERTPRARREKRTPRGCSLRRSGPHRGSSPTTPSPPPLRPRSRGPAVAVVAVAVARRPAAVASTPPTRRRRACAGRGARAGQLVLRPHGLRLVAA